MSSAILAVLTFITGTIFGIFHAKLIEVSKKLTEVHKKVNEPIKQSYVTLPSYYPNPLTKQTGQVVNPKTPEQLNREAQAKMLENMKSR